MPSKKEIRFLGRTGVDTRHPERARARSRERERELRDFRRSDRGKEIGEFDNKGMDEGYSSMDRLE